MEGTYIGGPHANNTNNSRYCVYPEWRPRQCDAITEQTVTHTEMVTNNQIYRGMTGIKVSLPSDMKNFPVELVPLP